MGQQSFVWLLAVFTALFFGGAAGHYLSETPTPYPYGYTPVPTSPSTPSTTAEPTTTLTTTLSTTITTTTTLTVTRTRGVPCPTAEAGVINFDNLNTTGVSPMPLIYEDFNFSGAAGWQYFLSTSFPASTPEYRSLSSPPNGLLSRSYGLVSFGSQGRNFSFDLTGVSFFAFAPRSDDLEAPLLVELELLMADEYSEVRYFEVPNAALGDMGPMWLNLTELGVFVNLVEVAVAVWQEYDYDTREGNPAEFVLDDLEYVKRRCVDTPEGY